MINEIDTERLILRKAKKDDLNDIYENIWSHEELSKYMLWRKCNSILEAENKLNKLLEFQKRNYFYFVEEKESKKVIGMAGIKDLGNNNYETGPICVMTSAQRKGYGKEILKALIYLVFDLLNGNKFTYTFMQENIPSKNLCTSQGFIYEKSAKSIRDYDNMEYMEDFYYMTREMVR